MLKSLKNIFVGNGSVTDNMTSLYTYSLIGITVFCMVYYPTTFFEKVFAAFMATYGTILGFKQGRSMPEQKNTVNQAQPDNPLPQGQDIDVQK